ncbi:MCE family protein [Mycolicibacterium aubagnense]
MSSGGAKRSHVRIAAAVLISVMVAAVVFTYLSYTAAFTPTDTVSVMAPRAGLVMDSDAKVKYRGIQVGKVQEIDYAGDQAKLKLSVLSDQMRYIPANARVRLGSTTGIPGPSRWNSCRRSIRRRKSLRPGALVQAKDVQLEMNTVFQTLTDLLDKIDPVSLNATVTALGEGLRGHGDDAGAAVAGLSKYLQYFNPKLPTLQQDFQDTATVAGIYGDAAPDLAKVLDTAPTVSKTLIDEKDDLNAALLASTGFANNAYATISPAADDYIAAIQRLRAPLKVLGDYSPEFPCLIQGLSKAVDRFGPVFGGVKPGLFVSSNFFPGAPNYTYPESLPMVNASGGPNCRGLPDVPSKQFGGSWYHTPFLVTDNAYIPFQPNTELQFDAPSTLQFLFSGAYAERDRY